MLFVVLITFLGCTTGTDGFWFSEDDTPVDCQVTNWSPWSEPYGFGLISRDRAVLRYPSLKPAGTGCPKLREEKSTTHTPTIKETAQVMETNFMNPVGSTSRLRRSPGSGQKVIGQLQEMLRNWQKSDKLDDVLGSHERDSDQLRNLLKTQFEDVNQLRDLLESLAEDDPLRDPIRSRLEHYEQLQDFAADPKESTERLRDLFGKQRQNVGHLQKLLESGQEHVGRLRELLERGPTPQIGQLRDLLIIIDSSGSITSSFFESSKQQIARLLSLLCPTPDPFKKRFHRAAVIQYSTDVEEIFDFDDNRNIREIQQEIKNIQYMNQWTCTGDAFDFGKSMFQISKGARMENNDIRKEVLILTDGQSNCGSNAINAAIELQDTAEVFALVIGTQSEDGKKEIEQYVSYPPNRHLFAIPGYRELETLLNGIEQLQEDGLKCAHFE